MKEFFGANVLEHPDGWKCGAECAFAAILFEALATATLDNERLTALAEMVRSQRDAKSSYSEFYRAGKSSRSPGDKKGPFRGLPEGVRRAVRAVYGLDLDQEPEEPGVAANGNPGSGPI